MSKQVLAWLALFTVMVVWERPSAAQLAPTGTHYAARPSDTGHEGPNDRGGYSTSIPLDLPASREGLPIPLQIVSGARGFGAAGVGWDIPLSVLRIDNSLARRRPAMSPEGPLGPRVRVSLSLLGRDVELLETVSGWIGRNAPDITMTSGEEAGTWVVSDGNGIRYTFVQDHLLGGTNGPFAGPGGIWLLDSIRGPSDAMVKLRYEIIGTYLPHQVYPVVSIDLVGITYNYDTAATCSKHEIRLLYDSVAVDAPPQAITVVGGEAIGRFHWVNGIDVMSRESCADAPQRLRRYSLSYAPDPDTQQQRLESVRMFGREGTPEVSQSLPVATYHYGSASVASGSGRALRYGDKRTIDLPPHAELEIAHSGKLESADFVGPSPGSNYGAHQSFLDYTGDGRPDLVFRYGGQLSIAAGSVGGVFGASSNFEDSVMTRPILDVRTSDYDRFYHPIPAINVTQGEYVWTQSIDVNGDGRIDIIDAAAKPHTWVIYLNTPDTGPSGIKWVRRAYDVTQLQQIFADRHLPTAGDYLPLSHRITGTDHCLSGCSEDDGFTHSPQQTYVDYEVKDLNGDGYPDVVFNSSAIQWVPSDNGYLSGLRLQPLNGYERVEAVFNVRGMFISSDITGTATYPFSDPTTYIPSSGCGVEKWTGGGLAGNHYQDAACTLVDVNGDGIVDWVVGLGARLGTGTDFDSYRIDLPQSMYEAYPSIARQATNYPDKCETPPYDAYWADASEVKGLRDVTGDGIPDFVDAANGHVYVGTGAGFASTPINIEGPFSLSHETEDCNGFDSFTNQGLYDVDGDGIADVVIHKDTGLDVYHLIDGTTPRNLDAGRIVGIENGYGANTTITYASAKDDTVTRHQVPFPEVVVASIETTGSHGLGGSLAATKYAYGDISLFYDSVQDAFRTNGYRRRVEMVTTLDPQKKSTLTMATITDRYPFADITMADLFLFSEKQRLGRYLQAGQVSDVTVLAGIFASDAWGLLAVDITTDPHRIAGQRYSVDTQDTHVFADTVIPADDVCKEIMFQYDYDKSTSGNIGDYTPCGSRGFLYTRAVQSWRGSAAPPAAENVQVATAVRSVDDYGRVTSMFYKNDALRTDDDVCVDTAYATPTSAPILTAVASRKVWDCGKNGTPIVLGEESWEYDKLMGGGLVFQGLPTSHTVYRHTTDTGLFIRNARQFDADFDVNGNPVKVVTTREDGTSRTTQIAYDAFGLAPTTSTVSGTDVVTQKSSQATNPITGQLVTRTDVNGTTRGATFDGFGRIVLETVSPVGAGGGVVAKHTYFGFDGIDPLGRRVSVKEFTDPIKENLVDTEPGHVTTGYLDELGRSRYGEIELGEDYASERMIVGARSYDLLGRVAFEADPYPASQNAATAYGTTQYFNTDGSPWVSVRGAGKQLFTTVPNASLELFPSVVTHKFANYTETVISQDASSLTSLAPQYGVTHESALTAIGRVLSTQTRQTAANLDYETFTYDLLGHQTSMTRYQNPTSLTNPVMWSWEFDTFGQTLHMNEPATAPQDREYSDWGELKSTTWTPISPELKHAVVNTYDALGRTTSSFEQNGGVTDPATLNRYVYDVPVSAPYLTPVNTIGRLTSASTPTDSVAYSYDGYGNLSASSFTDLSSASFVEEQSYHADGSQAWIQLRLPDATYVPERMDYAYDTAGRLRWMWFSNGTDTQELYNASTLDAFGRLRVGELGKTQLTASFDDVGRRLPKYTKLSSSLGTRSITYNSFDAVGRELSRYEDVPTLAGQETSTYDSLGRLKNSLRSNGATTLAKWAFTYDPLGNITKLDDQLGTADATMSYLGTDRDRICAIAYVGSPGSCNVEHDSFGNTTYEPTRTGFNKLSYFNSGDVRQISNLTRKASFTYDAFGGLQDLKVLEGEKEIRHDHHYGASITQRSQTGAGGVTTYIARQFSGPGLSLSRRGPHGRWIYEFGESRGTRFTTDENGKFVQDLTYTPFGNATSVGAAAGEPEFTTDQWNDGDALEGFGVLAVGKRLYDPSIGRFLSRDPLVVPREANASNPYSFAINDPVNLADPSGLDPFGSIWSTAGGDNCGLCNTLLTGAALLLGAALNPADAGGMGFSSINGMKNYTALLNNQFGISSVTNSFIPQTPPLAKGMFAIMTRIGESPAGSIATGVLNNVRRTAEGLEFLAFHGDEALEGLWYAAGHPSVIKDALGEFGREIGRNLYDGNLEGLADNFTTIASVAGPGLWKLSGLGRAGAVVGGAGGAGGVTRATTRLASVGDKVWESTGGLIYGPGGEEGNRVLHVLKHAEDIPTRAGMHGVFAGGRRAVLSIIDEAYARGMAGGPGVTVTQQGAKTVYEVAMKGAGYVGGRGGAALVDRTATHVKLVLKGRSVITAFPFIP